MKLNDFSHTPVEAELEYSKFYRSSYGSLDSNYNNLVKSCLREINKNLNEVRSEILYAEQNGTLDTVEQKALNFDLNNSSLEQKIGYYFKGWLIHDSFAYQSVAKLPVAIKNVQIGSQYIKRFISNDQMMRIYVSKNLPEILSQLRTRIMEVSEIDFVPPVSSFEVYLTQEAQKVQETEDEAIVSFANTYSYGDLDIAKTEINRLFSPSMKKVYARMNEARNRNIDEANKTISEMLKRGVGKDDIHNYIRLSHWAAFEEPKKRYLIEAGIVDYLYREMIFQNLKKSKDTKSIQNLDFALQMNQNNFLNLLRGI